MTATRENLTDTDDEMRVAFRQMAMTFAQLEKTRLVMTDRPWWRRAAPMALWARNSMIRLAPLLSVLVCWAQDAELTRLWSRPTSIRTPSRHPIRDA